jgi:zinc/manganese transport system substrate-binding protein
MNFNRYIAAAALSLMQFLSFNKSAIGAPPLKVVTTIPDLAWLASELGGDSVDARALLSGTENPHYVDAVPEFVRQVAEADLLCMVGLDLEIGYMPAVISRAGNAKVQPGGAGYCEVGPSISVLEKPQGPVDRSMGDIHPAGNPHFYLSPKAMGQASGAIAEYLLRLRPSEASQIQNRLSLLKSQLGSIQTSVQALLAPLTRDDRATVIEYHREFAYYFDTFGIRSFGSIEEKPGVPPSAGRLAEVALAAKSAGVRVVIAADYAPARTLKRFEELSGIPVVIVPTMMQPARELKTYKELQIHIATQIAAHASRVARTLESASPPR